MIQIELWWYKMGMCFFCKKSSHQSLRFYFFAQEMNVTLKTLTLDPLSFTIEDFFDKSLGGWDGWRRMNPEIYGIYGMYGIYNIY